MGVRSDDSGYGEVLGCHNPTSCSTIWQRAWLRRTEDWTSTRCCLLYLIGSIRCSAMALIATTTIGTVQNRRAGAVLLGSPGCRKDQG